MVVTNYHVISNAKGIKIKAENKVFNVGGIIYLDKENDIAVLKTNANHLKIVTLGDLKKQKLVKRSMLLAAHKALKILYQTEF